MSEGTYGFAYCATHGLGMGVFTVRGQAFVGVDAGGVQYSGTAEENEDGSIGLDLKLTMPAGSSSLQRGASQIIPNERHIQATPPAELRRRNTAGGSCPSGHHHCHGQASARRLLDCRPACNSERRIQISGDFRRLFQGS